VKAGLEPLALVLLENPTLNPSAEAEKYINAEHAVNDAQAALDGAKQILMERFSEDAKLVGDLREYLTEHGLVKSQVVDGKQAEGEKFRDYFDFQRESECDAIASRTGGISRAQRRCVNGRH
jgi:uncharacterized protein